MIGSWPFGQTWVVATGHAFACASVQVDGAWVRSRAFWVAGVAGVHATNISAAIVRAWYRIDLSSWKRDAGLISKRCART
jgi:hypothetical protein